MVNLLFAQTRNIPAGSVVIDMGVTPQTYANGLKPYGLVYNLLDIQKVPVVWSINPSKAKDGIDFTVDGRNFRGGTFIIEKQYVQLPNVATAINNFVSQGVVTYTTQANVTVPVHKVLMEFPRWVMDTNNGSFAIGYLTNAGIPSSAYKSALPSAITACDDLFILPHADPTWANHGKLWQWVQSIANGGNRGWLWSGCHAVSGLENTYNPANTNQQMNFLSTKVTAAGTGITLPVSGSTNYAQNSLILWGNHQDASSTPFQYSNPEDSPMQFMGILDGATKGGSEQIYVPVTGGGWRPTTNVTVWDINQRNVLGTSTPISPGKAAVIAYGPAFGDATNGMVMYEGGHQLTNGTAAENTAAQRAFLDFSFDAPTGKAPVITDNTAPFSTIKSGQTYNFSISAVSPINSNITYAWSSACGGTFSSTTSANPIFTAPVLSPGANNNVQCMVTVVVTDECGRKSFYSYPFTVLAPPAPPVANNDTYYTYNTNAITVNPLSNDTDLDNNIVPSSLTALSPTTVAGGLFTINSDGTVKFVPTSGFAGTATLNYQICDATDPADGGPLCSTATITVAVSTSPCTAPMIVKGETAYGVSVIDRINWGNASTTNNNYFGRVLGAPDNNGSVANNNSAYITIDLGGEAVLGTNIQFRIYRSNNGSPGLTGTVNASSSSSDFSVPTAQGAENATTSIVQDEFTVYNYLVTKPGMRYVRVTAPANNGNRFGLESVTYQKVVCGTDYCTKPGSLVTGGQPTKVGITIQSKLDTWPESIPNGHIALESKTSGFVITRVANSASIAEPKKGMLIYDIAAACVKLYNGSVWKCIERSCNE